jgi:hypothetical protein
MFMRDVVENVLIELKSSGMDGVEYSSWHKLLSEWLLIPLPYLLAYSTPPCGPCETNALP